MPVLGRHLVLHAKRVNKRISIKATPGSASSYSPSTRRLCSPAFRLQCWSAIGYSAGAAVTLIRWIAGFVLQRLLNCSTGRELVGTSFERLK
jgi:hypothetical protein